VTQLRKAILEELQRRNLSITTRIYLPAVEEFARSRTSKKYESVPGVCPGVVTI
jgi:hypothetical protein